MKGQVSNQKSFGLVLTGLLVALVSIAAVAVAGTGPTPVDEHLLQVFQTTGIPGDTTLPTVVATAGSTQITSTAFSRQVAIVRDNNSSRNLGMTESQIRTSAMNNLIRDAALYERAQAEHITVSNAEVQTFMQDQKQQLSRSEAANPDVTARSNAAIAANGDSSREAYWANRSVIEEYRNMLLKAKFVRAHVGPGASQEALEAFIKSAVASTEVHILIPL